MYLIHRADVYQTAYHWTGQSEASNMVHVNRGYINSAWHLLQQCRGGQYGLNEEGALTEYGLNEEGALTEYNSVHKKEVGQAVQGMLMAYSIGFSRNSL